MRVHNNNPIAALQKVYEQQKKPLVNNVRPETKDDGVQLSTEARFYNAARKALNDLPELETAKLDKLKEAVKTGSYHVKDEEIAEKILQESTLDELI